MKNLLIAFAAVSIAAAASQSASAGDYPGGGCNSGNYSAGCNTPFCQGHSWNFFGFFQKQPVPAFQAAPWYLYYPYNSYFMTAAPINGGAYYGPPSAGGPLMNPYFPPSNYPAAPMGR